MTNETAQSNSEPESRMAYPLREAAALLGISLWKCRNEIWQGRLQARRAGGMLLVEAEALRNWIEALPQAQQQPAGIGLRTGKQPMRDAL